MKLVSVIFVLIRLKCFSQDVILNEGFECQFQTTWDSLSDKPRVYVINPYDARKKYPVTIYSDKKDAVNEGFYSDNRCEGVALGHGFFTGLTLCVRGTPSMRDLVVIRMDTVLLRGESYHLSFAALYHKFTKYHIDSIQILLAYEKKDIDSWMSGNKYIGQYVSISLKDANNKDWCKLKSDFNCQHDYRFLVLGNLKSDDDTKIEKRNDCRCCLVPKSENWDYSELFVDDIKIDRSERYISMTF